MSAGIYCIQRHGVEKNYVGSSKDVIKRLSRQQSALEIGRHTCKELQADWDRLGPLKFSFHILRFCKTESEMVAEEKIYRENFNCYSRGKSLSGNAYSGGRPITENMHMALDLIKAGATPYSAAKAMGIAQSTISRSRIYREWLVSME